MSPTSRSRPGASTAAATMLLFLASNLLVACAGASESQGGGVEDPDATVRFAVTAPPTQMDPIKTTAEVRDNSYFAPIYDRLTTVSADQKVVPQLAESWETSEDGLTWTFALRRGVTFHDGSPVDAEAVVANLERAQAVQKTNAFVAAKLAHVVGFEASGEDTVTVQLEQPRPGLAAALAGPTMSIASPAAFDDLGTHPVGSGPFTFVKQTADRVVYARNADYWDKDRAHAAGLEIIGIPDGTARLNAVRSGQVDATVAQLDLAAQIKEMGSDPSLTVVEAPTMSTVTLYFNSNKAPLDDVRVRRALNYAVDRGSISKNLLLGLCTPTTQPFPRGPGHVDELDNAYPYDPDKAASLLKQAGVNSLEIQAISQTASLSKLVAPALQDQMKKAGVTVTLKPTNPADARPLFRAGNGDALVLQINGEADPSLMLGSNFLGPDNPGGLSPELTEIAQRAINSPIESEERTQLLEEFSTKVVESPVHVHVCGISDYFVGPSSIVGLDKMPWLGIYTNPDPSGLGLTK